MKNLIHLFILLIFSCTLFSKINITIKNEGNSNIIINEIYIVKNSEKDWGNNLLNKPLLIGESITFTLDPGSYKLKIKLSNGSENILNNINNDLTLSF